MWNFLDFTPLWHFSDPCDTKCKCVAPCDVLFFRKVFLGDDQFIFPTPATSYFGLSVPLWDSFLTHLTGGDYLLNLGCLFWPSVTDMSSPPARLLNGKAHFRNCWQIRVNLRKLMPANYTQKRSFRGNSQKIIPAKISSYQFAEVDFSKVQKKINIALHKKAWMILTLLNYIKKVLLEAVLCRKKNIKNQKKETCPISLVGIGERTMRNSNFFKNVSNPLTSKSSRFLPQSHMPFCFFPCGSDLAINRVVWALHASG